jgi:hypothetical protein
MNCEVGKSQETVHTGTLVTYDVALCQMAVAPARRSPPIFSRTGNTACESKGALHRKP